MLLIALLAITIDQNLQRVNAMKNLLASLVNLVAAIFFIFAADIDWLVASSSWAVRSLAAGSALTTAVTSHRLSCDGSSS